MNPGSMLPGFGQGNGPMPGDDPVLPGGIVGGYAEQQARDFQTGLQQDALMSGRMTDQVTAVLKDVLTSLASATLSQLGRTPGGATAAGQGQQLLSWGAAPNAPTSAPANPLPTQPPPTAPPEGQAAPGPTGPEYYHPGKAYQEARAGVHAMTMGSVAKQVAAPAARYFSEHTPDWRPETNAAGEEVYVQYRPDGGPGAGERIEGTETPANSGAGMRIRAMTGLTSNLSALAAGRGAVGSLGAFATRVAGPIGLAIGGAQVAGSFLESQTEKATPYRAAFGEQAGTFAGRERFGEWMAGLKGFGTIGGDRAREQYQQASALGLQGQRREGATDFATDMYMRFGMDTGESMAIVKQAIDSGNLSLRQFGEAITEVSRSAVEAGRSSSDAIKSFAEAQRTVAGQFGGPGSIQAATTMAAISDKLPKPVTEAMGDTKGLAEMFSVQNVQAVAAMGGQDPNAATFRATADPNAGAKQFFGDLGQVLVRQVAAVMGMGEQQLREAIYRETGGETISELRQKQILARLAGGEAQAGVVEQVMLQIAQQFGYQGGLGEVVNYFFEVINGVFGYDQQTTQAGTRAGRAAGRAFQGIFGGGGGGGGGAGGGFGAYHQISQTTTMQPNASGYGASEQPTGEATEQTNKILANIGIPQLSSGQLAMGALQPKPEDTEAFSAYVNYVARTGKGNAAVEALLNPDNVGALTEAADVSDAGDVRFRIGKGKSATEMTLAQIISSGRTGQLRGAEVVPTTEGENPVPVVQLELVGDAATVLRQRRGPSDEQRSGNPAPSYRNPSTIPSYGGQ